MKSAILIEEPEATRGTVALFEVAEVQVLPLDGSAVPMRLVEPLEQTPLEIDPPRAPLGAAGPEATCESGEALLVGPADAALADFPEPIAVPEFARSKATMGAFPAPESARPQGHERSELRQKPSGNESLATEPGESPTNEVAEPTQVEQPAETSCPPVRETASAAHPRRVVDPAARRAVAALPAEKKTLADHLLRLTRDEHKWLAVGLFAIVAGWIVVNSGWRSENSGYPMMVVGLILPVVPYLVQHYLGRHLQIQQVQQTLAACQVRATRQGNKALVYELRSSDFRRRQAMERR